MNSRGDNLMRIVDGVLPHPATPLSLGTLADQGRLKSSASPEATQ
jgi:hypothetical protein